MLITGERGGLSIFFHIPSFDLMQSGRAYDVDLLSLPFFEICLIN